MLRSNAASIAAGVQTKFFDLVLVHEILDGSIAYSHHLKVSRIIDSASTSGAAMIKLLNNGKVNQYNAF